MLLIRNSISQDSNAVRFDILSESSKYTGLGTFTMCLLYAERNSIAFRCCNNNLGPYYIRDIILRECNHMEIALIRKNNGYSNKLLILRLILGHLCCFFEWIVKSISNKLSLTLFYFICFYFLRKVYTDVLHNVWSLPTRNEIVVSCIP